MDRNHNANAKIVMNQGNSFFGKSQFSPSGPNQSSDSSYFIGAAGQQKPGHFFIMQVSLSALRWGWGSLILGVPPTMPANRLAGKSQPPTLATGLHPSPSSLQDLKGPSSDMLEQRTSWSVGGPCKSHREEREGWRPVVGETLMCTAPVCKGNKKGSILPFLAVPPSVLCSSWGGDSRRKVNVHACSPDLSMSYTVKFIQCTQSTKPSPATFFPPPAATWYKSGAGKHLNIFPVDICSVWNTNHKVVCKAKKFILQLHKPAQSIFPPHTEDHGARKPCRIRELELDRSSSA